MLCIVDAIQMHTHNICLYKEVDKEYTRCNLKTMELLDCALIGVCAVIRSNTVLRQINRSSQITVLFALLRLQNLSNVCLQHSGEWILFQGRQPLGSKFFPFRVNPLLKGMTIFQESKKEVTKVVPFVQNCVKATKCIPSS